MARVYGTAARDGQAHGCTARTIDPYLGQTIGSTAGTTAVRRCGGAFPPPPVPSPAMLRRRLAAPALLLAVALATAACGSRNLVASFDPASACTTDGREPGAYPDLEALLPTAYQGKPPATVDSGRSCTTSALGTLATHGITGVRFAGATWSLGASTALTVAVFDGTGLDAPEMLEFYETPARSASHTDTYTDSDVTVGGLPGKRLDVLNTDGTGQTIVAWPSSTPGRVHVLLASDLGDANVAAALVTFGAQP